MAKQIPKPSDEDKAKGWTNGFSLVQEVTRRTYKGEHAVCMDDTHEVIEALIEMGYIDRTS